MATSAVVATSPAALAALRAAQTLTSELRLSRFGIALHEILERLLGCQSLVESLLAQRLLVEGSGHLVTFGKRSLHLRVLHLRAVEHRLREETLADAILRVVGEIGGRELPDVISKFLECELVAPLREIERCL